MKKNSILYELINDIISYNSKAELNAHEIYDQIASNDIYISLFDNENNEESLKIKEEERNEIKREIRENFKAEYTKRIDKAEKSLFDLNYIELHRKELFDQIREMVFKKLLSNEDFRSKILTSLRKKILLSITSGHGDSEYIEVAQKIESLIIEELMHDSKYIDKLEEKITSKLAEEMFK